MAEEPYTRYESLRRHTGNFGHFLPPDHAIGIKFPLPGWDEKLALIKQQRKSKQRKVKA